ncbi:MAG: 23S rRNA (uracil(1939)-C(5))-methyltransferase RlmD [bacterium]
MNIKIGHRIRVTGEKLIYGGSCLSKLNDFIIFTPYLIPGERAEVLVVKKTSSYAITKILKLEKDSKYRISPPCPYHFKIRQNEFNVCGGCAWQHIEYNHQLFWKKKIFQEIFFSINNTVINDIQIEGMNEPWDFRHKIQVPVEYKHGDVKTGFYKPQSHNVVDIDKCLIQNELGNRIFQTIRGLLNEFYRNKSFGSYSNFSRHILIRVSSNEREGLVCFITRGREFPKKEIFIKRITKFFPEVKGISQNINSRTTNVILGEKTKQLWGDGFIKDAIGPAVYYVSPESFFQTNPKQTLVLYNYVKSILTKGRIVLDLYSGSGGIGLFIADAAKKVIGIEENIAAVKNAVHSARMNRFDHCVFIHGSVEKVLQRLAVELHSEGEPLNAIVNPPRSGCSVSFLKSLVTFKPAEIIYVSCNPITLMRDLKILLTHYKIEKAKIFDLFPHMYHMESVVKLVKR